MDKFGIFNLLNSFLTPSSPSQKPTEDVLGAENASQNSAPSDFLSSLLTGLKGKPSTDEQPLNNAPPLSPKTSIKPLQQQMLSTMHQHDELIRRINKNNSKTPR